MINLKNLKMARYVRGMSQRDLAEASGVHRCSISNMELGQAQATPKTAQKLSRALNFQLVQLMSENPEVLKDEKIGTQEHGAPGSGGSGDGSDPDNIQHKNVGERQGTDDVGSESLQPGPGEGGKHSKLPERSDDKAAPARGKDSGPGEDRVPSFLGEDGKIDDPGGTDPDFD